MLMGSHRAANPFSSANISVWSNHYKITGAVPNRMRNLEIIPPLNA